jgi:hypothetical protein
MCHQCEGKLLVHDRSRAAVGRLMLALPRMFPHLDLKKCNVERENEEVKLIEPRDVQ